MSSQKEPRTSSASRLIALGLAAAVAVAAAFYFVLGADAQYAMRTLVDAVKAKDIAYVDQHVDKTSSFRGFSTRVSNFLSAPRTVIRTSKPIRP